MNRLQSETSPYLLQHAKNPVDWYPWGDEAFDLARRSDRPVFLSIGYSTCHWCHVMAHECFEDTETAQYLNEWFVSVKVDREQRPDIDSIYMEACQQTTGSGGWPLSLFLNFDQKPFFAGTYFPKKHFLGLLKQVRKLWMQDREQLLENGDRITAALKSENRRSAPNDVVEETFRYLSSAYDPKYGGFGSAPKFPMPVNLRFLLHYHRRTDNSSALSMVETTLTAMAKGGIFDQIGYGFSRYSTDRFWLVPHFEKMLYDNAQLISIYLDCFRLTKKEEFRTVAVRCLEYVMRDLSTEGGAFASAEDADSDGEEGLFYLFSYNEIHDVLEKTEAETFCDLFDITEEGNFEGKNIPNQIRRQELSFDPFHQKLYDYRKTRRRLHRDDKVLTVWNCLMISALCDAFSVLDEEKYLDAARKTYAFLERNCIEDDCIFTGWRSGRNNGNSVLDDYAFFLSACIDLYSATLETPFIERAVHFLEIVEREFADPAGGYFLTTRDSKLLLRPKEIYDGVIPCGNSKMAENLLFLSFYTDDVDAEPQFAFLRRQGLVGGLSHFAAVLQKRDCFRKVTVSTPRPCELDRTRFTEFDLVKIVEPCEEYPLKDGRTTFYVCEKGTCLPPSNEISFDFRPFRHS